MTWGEEFSLTDPLPGVSARAQIFTSIQMLLVIFPTGTARGSITTGSLISQIKKFPFTLVSPQPKSTTSSLESSAAMMV